MVNSFFWGDPVRAWKENIIQYPLVCSWYDIGNLYNNTSEIQFKIVVMDKHYKDWKKNLNDVESDVQQIARHFFQVINKSPKWQKLGKIQGAVAMTSFKDDTGDEVAGVQLTINFVFRDNSGTCDLPIFGYDYENDNTGSSCLPVIVFNSDNTYQVEISSGEFLELPDTDVTVKDTLGNTLGAGSVPSVSGGDVVVEINPEPCEDATLTLNGDAFLTVPAGDTQDIELRDQDDNIIDPLSVVDNVVKVDIPVAVSRSTAKPMRTGADVSYRTGDDFNLNLGRETDFLTLDAIPLNNDGSPTINTTTFRFTDTLGGQTFANGIAIDWSTFDGSTVLGYVITPILASSWNDAIDSSLAYTNGAFTTGWHLTNQNEFFGLLRWTSLTNTSAHYKMSYPPFNLTADRTIWVSNTYALGTLQAYAWRPLTGGSAITNKTTSTYYYIPCRYFNVVGVTLT